MSPTMYLHWLFARRIETASFSDFLVRRSKVGRALEIRFSVPATSNPKQARQFHSRSRERNRVERIRNIYERACFLPFRSLRQQGESQARPPGRRGAAQFHERPARKTATENRIEFHDTARLEFNLDALLKSFEPTSNESCFESSLFQKGCAHGPSPVFAFYSPRLILIRTGRVVKRSAVRRGPVPDDNPNFLLADDTLGMWWAPTVAVRAALLFLGELWRCGVQR